ncbi:transmembrane protein [Salix suchowensis]|nr:transmembrane protein [Salix suchowensis]
MEELKSSMEAHLDQMADLVLKLSSELRSGFRPAIDNFIGFLHAIDWTSSRASFVRSWIIGILLAHLDPRSMCFPGGGVSSHPKKKKKKVACISLAGVYLAEKINRVMGDCWRSFASQNYFDPHGVFLSVVWSGPLLIIATIILMNSLFSLCYMIVRWKRAELRHRARLARGSNKQD